MRPKPSHELTNEEARRFVEACATDKPAARKYFDRILPMAKGIVQRRSVGYTEAMAARGVSVDDVVQEVLLLMLKNPPDSLVPGREAVSLMAWIKTTTIRYLGQTMRRKPLVLDDEQQAAWPDPRTSGSREARDSLADIRRVLAEHSPRLLEFYEFCCQNPTLTDTELASALDTTLNNVQQLRSRMRSILAKYYSDSDGGES